MEVTDPFHLIFQWGVRLPSPVSDCLAFLEISWVWKNPNQLPISAIVRPGGGLEQNTTPVVWLKRPLRRSSNCETLWASPPLGHLSTYPAEFTNWTTHPFLQPNFHFQHARPARRWVVRLTTSPTLQHPHWCKSTWDGKYSTISQTDKIVFSCRPTGEDANTELPTKNHVIKAEADHL